jgi:hypothetical protein
MYDGTQAIHFQPDHPCVVGRVDHIREDLRMLRDRKRAHDAMMGCLPEGNLDYQGLFGSTPPTEVISDNSHLTILGARLAGEAIAKEALRRIGK